MADWSLIGGAASIAGVGIGSYTLVKVRSVSRAQRDERRLMRELYDVDAFMGTINKAMIHLGAQADPDAQRLMSELAQIVGTLEGVGKALDATDGVHHERVREPGVVHLQAGYCSSGFYTEIINGARDDLRLLVYRNMQLATVEVLEALRHCAESGCQIKLLCLSYRAPAAVLRHAVEIVPRPVPTDIDEFKKQLESAQRHVCLNIEQWSNQAKRNIEYRTYRSNPGPHFFIADGHVHIGFLNTATTSQPESIHDRQYLTLPLEHTLGQQMEHEFQTRWDLAEGALGLTA
jgi:hypothetical protein